MSPIDVPQGTHEPRADGLPTAHAGAAAFHSDRRYRFDAPPGRVWDGIGQVDRYPEWWPWLRRFHAVGLTPGDVWECEIQPPMPYVLGFRVTIEEVVDFKKVVAGIDGDVVGAARLSLAAEGGGCVVRIVSTLAPTNRTLRLVARVARPIAHYGHAWVLDTGARQFAAGLRGISRR